MRGPELDVEPDVGHLDARTTVTRAAGLEDRCRGFAVERGPEDVGHSSAKRGMPRPKGWRQHPPRSNSQSMVNIWVCGFRWSSRIAPAVSFPLYRKMFKPSVMFVS